VRPRNEEHLFQCANDAGDANDAPVSCRNYLICSTHSKIAFGVAARRALPQMAAERAGRRR
jgi:hypothetical protein